MKTRLKIELTLLDILYLFLGLMVGNFLYQQFNDKEWDIAIERTYFQYTALFGMWIYGWVMNKISQKIGCNIMKKW